LKKSIRNLKVTVSFHYLISILCIDSDEALVKDSELQNHLNALDDEEKALLIEEQEALEELEQINEKHRGVDLVYNKVIHNLGLMIKKPLNQQKKNSLKDTFPEESEEKEDIGNPEFNVSHIDTAYTEYEAYLNESLYKINTFIANNNKNAFEELLKQRGYLEYAQAIKPDNYLKTGNIKLEKNNLKEIVGSLNDSNIEYDYGDPEVENEDKKIKEVTDSLIEENKLTIVSIN
jgi:hypothetical protein